MSNEPFFACQAPGCGQECIYPADELQMLYELPTCAQCYHEATYGDPEANSDVWDGLPAFIPDADKRIAELEAEVARLMLLTSWRPMETAPKDGTSFLCVDAEEHNVVYYCVESEGWYLQDNNFIYMFGKYWMPLLAPPASPENTPTEGVE